MMAHETPVAVHKGKPSVPKKPQKSHKHLNTHKQASPPAQNDKKPAKKKSGKNESTNNYAGSSVPTTSPEALNLPKPSFTSPKMELRNPVTSYPSPYYPNNGANGASGMNVGVGVNGGINSMNGGSNGASGGVNGTVNGANNVNGANGGVNGGMNGFGSYGVGANLHGVPPGINPNRATTMPLANMAMPPAMSTAMPQPMSHPMPQPMSQPMPYPYYYYPGPAPGPQQGQKITFSDLLGSSK